MSPIRGLFAVLIVLDLAACAETSSPEPTDLGSGEPIPTAASSLVAGFVWQTDGLFGYRMLRPAGWDARDAGTFRGYYMPGFLNTGDRISLNAFNLKALEERPNTVSPQLFLFEQRPSLDGWTAGLEQMYKADGIEATLLGRLPQAKIYSLKHPGSSDAAIVAYAVDKGQPLVLGLTASGSYADLDRLRREGTLNDFGIMVGSVQAIPKDPENVEPPLK